MQVEFADETLSKLETDLAFNAGLGREIVSAFRRRMQAIRSALDERDLRAFKSWHFEKLKGERADQYSIRLNIQFRMIIEICHGTPKNVIRVIGIENHYKV